MRGGAGRVRSGGDRRGAGLGLPLLQPGLPGPGPARGRRDLADRPDPVRLPRPAPERARRHRVDPARRHPGPALPGRGRPAADPVVRHRARRTAARLSARGTGHPGGDGAGPAAGEGALGGRLVDPTAARALAGVRRPGRRAARRAPRGAGRRAGGRRQDRVGSAGVRLRPGVRAGAAGRAVAAYLRVAQGPRSSGPGRRPRPVGDARRDRRAARRDARADPAGLRDRRSRARPALGAGGPARHQGLPRARSRALRQPLGRRPAVRPRDARERAAQALPAYRRPTDTTGLGGARPRRRPQTQPRPAGDDQARQGARPAGREPAHPRPPPAHPLDATVDARARPARRGRAGPARGVRRPAVADRPGRAGAGLGDRLRRRGPRARGPRTRGPDPRAEEPPEEPED